MKRGKDRQACRTWKSQARGWYPCLKLIQQFLILLKVAQFV